MQHASVYLYSNLVEIFINPSIFSLQETYNKVYNRNLKIVRGINNTIELRIKNSDQRLANLNNDVYLVFNLVDGENDRHIFQKDCLLKDPTTGIASVTITEQELVDITPGFYNYSIIQEKREYIESGSEEYTVLKRMPTYIDTMFTMDGIVEVKGNIKGDVQSSITIDKFLYVNPRFMGEPEPAHYISSIINANRYITKLLHTFQFYFDETFDGEVVIQASIDEQGGTPNTWVDVDTFESTGINEYRNITGKYNWFRIKYIPIKDFAWSINYVEQKDIEGKIQKILYR